MNSYDFLITGGRVIDPANRRDDNLDVAIKGGCIAAVAAGLNPQDAAEVYDAAGQLVVPGLVDLHMHGYERVTPIGIDVDHYCLGRGVTTAVDAGSAGFATFPGFRAFAVERVRTRLLAFLHISRVGLAFAGLGGDGETPGELESPRFANVDGCVQCIEENRDVVIGVKIRLSSSIADNGRNEAEAYRKALEASAEVKLPLMVHYNFSTVPMDECLGQLRRGDILTHCFHGFPNTIINPETRAIDARVRQARQTGVIMDVGHGQGSFNWTVAQLARADGFWPDSLGSDLHSGTCEGPAYDVPTVMTRLLHLGMPLVDVIRAATLAPAKAIGWDDRIGTLGVGREADVTILSLEEVDIDLEDCQSQLRRITQRVVPRAVWRAGQRVQTTSPEAFPNPKTIEAQARWWSRLIIRDEEPPAGAAVEGSICS